MNAPVPADHMAQLAIEHLPLDSIKASPTNPRKRFDQDYLLELATSIKTHGVIQPITVRPIGKPAGTVQYEIVVGECRWRASKLAERGHIPALIRDIPDVAVLELQITENLQRNDLAPLEEADGYQALMKLKKINADQLAELIGKSRSYVYTRTKLSDLCPEARKALQEGLLDASRGLLIARIGHHDNQRQALKEITKKDWEGEIMSYRIARDHVHRNYTLALKAAPFDIKDAALLAKAGACTICPKRSGNAPDLFQDIKGPDVCTDPKCFGEKRTAHYDAMRAAAEAKGQTIITGKAAEAIFPHSYNHQQAGGGYLTLDTAVWDDPKHRKVSQILGKNAEAVELVQNPHTGAIVEVAKQSAITAALNEKGIKTTRQQSARSAKSRVDTSQSTEAQKKARKLKEAVDAALLQAVHDKHPQVLGRSELGALGYYILEAEGGDLDQLAEMHGMKAGSAGAFAFVAAKLRELTGDKLAALVLDLFVLANDQYAYNAQSKEWTLRAIAKRYKIDVAAIEKRVKAELAATAKPAAEPKAEKAPAKPKPAPKKKAAKK